MGTAIDCIWQVNGIGSESDWNVKTKCLHRTETVDSYAKATSQMEFQIFITYWSDRLIQGNLTFIGISSYEHLDLWVIWSISCFSVHFWHLWAKYSSYELASGMPMLFCTGTPSIQCVQFTFFFPSSWKWFSCASVLWFLLLDG